MPQRVAVIKEEAMTFACQRNADVAVQVAFCHAALNRVGLEFTHAFTWYVRECFSSVGLRPTIETVDQYTGLRDRRKIVHMWGQWHDGTRIDVQFEPSGDFGDQFRGYWGAYKLVVWRPSGS